MVKDKVLLDKWHSCSWTLLLVMGSWVNRQYTILNLVKIEGLHVLSIDYKLKAIVIFIKFVELSPCA